MVISRHRWHADRDESRISAQRIEIYNDYAYYGEWIVFGIAQRLEINIFEKDESLGLKAKSRAG